MDSQPTSATANWMIMAYIAADDLLADFAVGSLQQLRRLAEKDPNVVVAAQFDANGKQNIPRLIFDAVGSKSDSIHNYKKDEIDRNTVMADPTALTDFINWAYAQRRANHYCLVLWGHGPELLVDPNGPNGTKAKRFLSPCDVRDGMIKTKFVRDGQKFDILAIDACNMSMIELAGEIAEKADFLIASQEEVPDFSFPYHKLFALGMVKGESEITKACRKIPDQYIDAYQDYTRTQTTQTSSITLSSLSLKNAKAMIESVDRLADAMLRTNEDRKRKVIVDARANSKSFVAGLYVDLYDFCQQLRSQLGLNGISDQSLTAACEEICDTIQSRDDTAFIIANQVSQDRRCHGISIYFPYLASTGVNPTDEPLVKDGISVLNRDDDAPDGELGEILNGNGRAASGRAVIRSIGLPALERGGTDVLSKGGTDVLSKLRRQRIEETEEYYSNLKLAKETSWDEFIRYCWSRWLLEDVEATIKSSRISTPDILDQQYSAQQCALNLLSLCRKLEKAENSSGTRVDAEPANNVISKGWPT